MKKDKIILPLFDGGVTNVDYDSGYTPGWCETCDFGSHYFDDVTVELTGFRILIHVDCENGHFFNEGWLLRQLLTADHGMTENQFVTWLKAVLNQEFQSSEEAYAAYMCGNTPESDFCVENKHSGSVTHEEFPAFDRMEFEKRRRREQDEH